MDLFESWIAKQRIAHRGLFCEEAPENTVAAFLRAANNGYAVELDVRRLDDGTLIVFHDETLGRMTNRDGYVSTLKKENLADLFVGKSKEKIPTLQEALDAIGGKVPVLIDVKSKGATGAIENALIEILNKYEGDFAVQSDNPLTLEIFKNNAPHFFRGQVATDRPDKSVPFLKRRALANLKYNKNVSCPHFIAYDLRGLPNPYVAKYRKKVPVIAWTVKSNDDFERIKNFADNIIFENRING